MDTSSLFIELKEDTPAVFVVHGIGKQNIAETSANMYAQFDETIESILFKEGDSEDKKKRIRKEWENEPAPFAYDGFWGDYDDVKSFFGDQWDHLSKTEKNFLPQLWKARVVSAWTTYLWFIRQLFGLLNPVRSIRILKFRSLISYPIYTLLVPVGFLFLTLAYVRRNKILKDFLNDVRLYVDPKGKLEKNIKKMIDARVEESFMRLIGLKPDFSRLPDKDCIYVGGKPRRFKRVVWVAHSLGTVISYNVLGGLLSRAHDLEQNSIDDEVKAGVEVFREAMARFVTIGSPLDKIALLFGERAIPKTWKQEWRKGFLNHGEFYEPLTPEWIENRQSAEKREAKKVAAKEWWVNFYHYFDPVSGSLGSKYLFGDDPPVNFHSRSGWIPGLSHNAYWKDSRILRYIVSRAFAKKKLDDESLKHLPRWVRFGLWALGYLIWIVIVAGVYCFVKDIVWPLLMSDLSFWEMLITVYDCAVAAF
ncbi:MAG: hypothetical protein IIB00_06920 [candidate division Zixibacteria bacterium]|nr:hypothetical protein [candidate division Zixibacteria bacterium]